MAWNTVYLPISYLSLAQVGEVARFSGQPTLALLVCVTETSGTCPGYSQCCTVCNVYQKLQQGSALLHQCLCRLGLAVVIAGSILATHKSTCISVWLLSPHISLNSIQLELQVEILCIPFHCSRHRTLSRAQKWQMGQGVARSGQPSSIDCPTSPVQQNPRKGATYTQTHWSWLWRTAALYPQACQGLSLKFKRINERAP